MRDTGYGLRDMGYGDCRRVVAVRRHDVHVPTLQRTDRYSTCWVGWRGAVRYTMYRTPLSDTIHCTHHILYCTVQYCTALYSTVLSCTVLCSSCEKDTFRGLAHKSLSNTSALSPGHLRHVSTHLCKSIGFFLISTACIHCTAAPHGALFSHFSSHTSLHLPMYILK